MLTWSVDGLGPCHYLRLTMPCTAWLERAAVEIEIKVQGHIIDSAQCPRAGHFRLANIPFDPAMPWSNYAAFVAK